ncbi:adenosine receptor A1-like [Gadus morhua]|uniref:Adenosine receptor A1-like n=1 Tax=Gadus morhua TaxID=8049 RepID=A0A8C5A1Z6_GADMO|nr:adenosine receptor A1-like [Gadus morhua]
MNTTGGCMSSMPLGYDSILRAPYIAAELLIALAAVIGNLLVCLAVRWNRKLQTVTNYFLVSLSVADILVGLLAIPCAVLTDLGRPHNDLPLCLVLLSILMVLTQSSILSMLAVAVERYVAILRPFHYQRVMSPRNARLALLLTWSLALVSGSVPIMDWQSQNHDAGYCLFTCVVDMSYMVYFNFFGLLLLPLLVMFIIYAHIFYTIRHQLRRIAVARGSPSEAGPTPSAGVSVTGDGGTRGPETRGDGAEQGAPTLGAADSGLGGAAVGGSGQRITPRSVGAEVVGFSSRGATRFRFGEGKRVRVGAAVDGPDAVVEEEEEEDGHARLKAVMGGAEAGAKRARSRPMDRASRGGVGKTTPRLEALREAGGAREPDPGEPAGAAASKQTASGTRTQSFGPLIQTKTTTVIRKMSRQSTRTSCSGSDDRSSGSTVESNKPSTARARLEIQKATSLFLVLFLFMVCLMPIHLINCLLLLRPQCPVPMSITLAAILLSHANSALNPLLYAYRMRSFRHTLRGMCSRRSSPKHH